MIEHDEYGPVESVGDRFVECGYDLEVFRVLEDPDDPVSTAPFPDPAGFDALLVTGSVWSLTDTAPIDSWVHREVAMVRTAHEADTPVLGMCFGGQVLSVALGGSVQRLAKPEFGWHDVDMVGTVPQLAGEWFQWHYDGFTVPGGATELAANGNGPQAFRIGRSLGTQFHPAVTPRLIGEWLDTGSDDLVAHGIDPQALLAGTVERAEVARRRAAELVDWFLDEVTASPNSYMHTAT